MTREGGLYTAIGCGLVFGSTVALRESDPLRGMLSGLMLTVLGFYLLRLALGGWDDE